MKKTLPASLSCFISRTRRASVFHTHPYLCVGNGLGKALSSDCNAAPLDLKAAWITAQNFGNLYHRSSVGPGISKSSAPEVCKHLRVLIELRRLVSVPNAHAVTL